MRLRKIGVACLLLTSIICSLFMNKIEINAAEEMHASEELIQFIKDFESFSEKPYWDYAQWTAGYGTKVPTDELAVTMMYGIAPSRADQLMREHVKELEQYVRNFEKENKIKLNQNQFDAILSFTYNCGPGWLQSSTPRDMILKCGSEEDIMYSFGLWSTAGGYTLPGLVKRRLCEANLFSNGIYSTEVPENYYYVSFKPTIGKTPVLTQCFMGEHESIKSGGHSVANKFIGWFTDPVDGEEITELTPEMNKQIVFAHWDGYQEPEITLPDTIKQKEFHQPLHIAVKGDGVNIRDYPGLSSNIIDVAMDGEKLNINWIADVDGIVWGHSGRGWIALKLTTYTGSTYSSSGNKSEPVNTYAPRTGLICAANDVDTKEQPGTRFKTITKLPKDMQVTIYEEKEMYGLQWGRTVCGWIPMQYVDFSNLYPDWYDPKNPQRPQKEEIEDQSTIKSHPYQNKNHLKSGWGTVRVNNWLNIRQTPSVDSNIVGKCYNGEKKYISEIQYLGGLKWGKTNDGWICLSYFAFD